MISFEMPKSIRKTTVLMETIAENMMRPVARYFDEHEHEIPWDYINFMHEAMKQMGAGSIATQEVKKKKRVPGWAINVRLSCSRFSLG